MITSSPYNPPRWLRSPHLQSLIATSPVRRARGAVLLRRSGAVSTPYIVDGGDGVRLEGVHSRLPGAAPRGLALLLHGWEGSAESSYMRLTAAHLLGAGFEVFRLNFRDHGDTHHLNQALFHSNRIDEVMNAATDVANRFLGGSSLDGSPRPMVVAGYSLGGNFALRVAMRARAAGLPVQPLERFRRDADWIGVHRHLKVIGIFARLNHRDAKPKYLADAPRFLAYLDGVVPKYPELAPLGELLGRHVRPTFA